MDPMLVSVLSTYGPAALVGLLLAKWLGGLVLSRLFPAKVPAPLPGVNPDTPLVAPSSTPLVLQAVQLLAQKFGHPIPASLSAVSAEVLTTIRDEILSHLAKSAPPAPPPAPPGK